MKRTKRCILTLLSTTMLLVILAAGPAAAHPHVVSTPDHRQVLANGQNHPGFQTENANGLRLSCEGGVGACGQRSGWLRAGDGPSRARCGNLRKGRRVLRDAGQPPGQQPYHRLGCT